LRSHAGTRTQRRSGPRVRVATENVGWPSIEITHAGYGTGVQRWQCVQERWTGHLFDDDRAGEPVATIQTTIAEDAGASEVADGIKAIHRLLCPKQQAG
jgi:hypothetical protein